MSQNDILKRFGERIRELRTAKGWSQEKLSFESDLHRTYIGAVERGEKNISLKNIEQLSNTFKISLSELFNFKILS